MALLSNMSAVDLDNCIVCKVSESNVTNMDKRALLVNSALSCLHKFCCECIERLFSTKTQFACPACKTIVYRRALEAHSRDELEVKNDAMHRKRLKKIYNKSESDFAHANDFRDYEEMVEDYIYNLAHGINVADINAKIKLYQEQNSDTIRRNQANLDKEKNDREARIQDEEYRKEQLKNAFVQEDAHDRAMRIELRRQTNELQLGERDRVTVQDTTAIASSSGGLMLPSPVILQLPVQPNQLTRFLSQRSEPKCMVKPKEADGISKQAERKKGLQYLLPGGFNENVHRNRNWVEMTSGLEAIVVVQVKSIYGHDSVNNGTSAFSISNAVCETKTNVEVT